MTAWYSACDWDRRGNRRGKVTLIIARGTRGRRSSAGVHPRWCAPRDRSRAGRPSQCRTGCGQTAPVLAGLPAIVATCGPDEVNAELCALLASLSASM